MMAEVVNMTLQQIRRKYHKQIICPDMIKGDAWNVLIEASALTFHYYWEDDSIPTVVVFYTSVRANHEQETDRIEIYWDMDAEMPD